MSRSLAGRSRPALMLLAAALCAPSSALAPQLVDELARAAQLLEACRAAEARSILQEQLAETGDHPEVSFRLGMSYLAENDHDPALVHLQRATELDPQQSDYARLLGEAFGRKARNAGMLAQISLARSAREGFERAVEIDPDNLAARRNLVEFYERAPGLMGGGRQKAEEQVAAIAERDAALGHEARGLLYRWQRRDEEAIEEYRQAIVLAPDLAMPRYELGFFLLERDRPSEAADVLAETIRRFPDHKLAHYYLGEAAAESVTHLDPARAALERYLELPLCHEDPTRAEALVQLGTVLEHLGETKAALAAFEEALELSPDLKPARKAIRRLGGG